MEVVTATQDNYHKCIDKKCKEDIDTKEINKEEEIESEANHDGTEDKIDNETHYDQNNENDVKNEPHNDGTDDEIDNETKHDDHTDHSGDTNGCAKKEKEHETNALK